nr:RNA-dependent RNA polymerase [Red clover mottle virus]
GAEKYFNFYPIEYDAAEGIARVGELKPKLYIPLPKKTSLVKTPEEWHLGTPCDKVPSILVKGDPRLADTVHADYDPCLSGLTKYSTPMSPLDSVLLGETCQEILDEWFDCLPEGFELGEVTINEALNGVDGVDYMDRIPLATSEGFPHVMSREQGEKGKQRFVQGDGHIVSLIPGTSVHEAYETLSRTIATEVPTLVGIECPKDEKLPFRKVFTKPKTRNFTILPMEYNILVRQYFLNFVRFIMKKRDVLPCQVGINPYSMEWSIVASRLKSQGNDILCCDYSSFDGLLSKQIMEMMADMINRFCGGGTLICAKRKNLLMACCSRLAISRDSVWRIECGIPSGFPLTVICNSIFNEILVRYHYKLLLQEHNAPNMYVQSFKNLISMVTYGDDNLISVNAVVKPYFDGTKLKQAMARNGIIITDGKDKTSATLEFRRLEDCDFLKRGFLKRSSVLWDAPEEKASLWAQLHYVNVNNCEMQVAYMTNLVNVLRELYMHDPTEMVEFRRLALKSIPWLNTTDLPTLYQVKEFYAEQRLRNIPDHNDSLDMLTSVDLLGPAILGEGVPQEALVLSELLEVRDLRYHTVPDNDNGKEVWILFNTMYPQKLLPSNCHSFTWNCGQGRGGLPTQHWLATNVTRTDSKLNKLIRTAVAANKKIVLATKDNILPINVIAVLLAARNKVMPSLATNALLTYVIGAAKKLNFLTSECQFAFFNV